jgi:hypothetical protein
MQCQCSRELVAGSREKSQVVAIDGRGFMAARASQLKLGHKVPHGRRDSPSSTHIPKTVAMTMRARFHH